VVSQSPRSPNERRWQRPSLQLSLPAAGASIHALLPHALVPLTIKNREKGCKNKKRERQNKNETKPTTNNKHQEFSPGFGMKTDPEAAVGVVVLGPGVPAVLRPTAKPIMSMHSIDHTGPGRSSFDCLLCLSKSSNRVDQLRPPWVAHLTSARSSECRGPGRGAPPLTYPPRPNQENVL
jgi:hypothetical protein